MMFRRRRTVTTEMRAAFARQMAESPSHEVMAGLDRVYRSAQHLAAIGPQKRRYAESGAAHELEFYGGER